MSDAENGELRYLIRRIEGAVWGERDTPGLVGHVAELSKRIDEMQQRQRWAVWAVVALAIALIFQTAEKNAWLIKLLGI